MYTQRYTTSVQPFDTRTPFIMVYIFNCTNLHPHSQYRMLLSVKSSSLQHTGHSTSSSSLVDAISSLAYQLHYTIPFNRFALVLYSIYTIFSLTFAPPKLHVSTDSGSFKLHEYRSSVLRPIVQKYVRITLFVRPFICRKKNTTSVCIVRPLKLINCMFGCVSWDSMTGPTSGQPGNPCKKTNWLLTNHATDLCIDGWEIHHYNHCATKDLHT